MSNSLPVVIKYGTCNHVEIYTYPDGQQNVKLDMNYFNDCKMIIDIKCSIKNFKELEVLLCIIAALRKNDFHIDSINFIYLFGMRSDRSFEIGMPNYFRDVLSPIINGLNINNVFFMQPHSYLSLKSILNFSIDNMRIYDILSSPDIYHSIKIGGDTSADSWGHRLDGTFIKNRNFDGSITLTLKKEIKNLIASEPERSICIVDDICDGGATFIAASEYIKKDFPDRKLYLFIAHGIFSKGIDHVSNHFDKIITTNSYQEIDHPKVIQHKVI